MYSTIDMKSTGKRIRRIMNQRKLTVKDVQEHLNLSSVQSVYHWLNGKSMPTVDNLYALSELFRIPIDAMVVGNGTYHMGIYAEAAYIRIYGYCVAIRELRAV